MAARPGVASTWGPRAAPAAPAPGLRRPAVLALVATATVVLAGLAWALVRAGAEVPEQGTSTLVPPPTPAASAATSPVATPSTPAGDADAGDPAAVAPSGRNPFGGPPPASPAAPTTQPPPASVVTGTLPPASPGATGTAAPTAAPTTGAASSPAGATATVTVTTTTAATYLGFYAWSGDKASFRVNTRTYSASVGATFGPRLTFSAIVPGSPRCAKVRHGSSSLTLCPGQVVRLP